MNIFYLTPVIASTMILFGCDLQNHESSDNSSPTNDDHNIIPPNSQPNINENNQNDSTHKDPITTEIDNTEIPLSNKPNEYSDDELQSINKLNTANNILKTQDFSLINPSEIAALENTINEFAQLISETEILVPDSTAIESSHQTITKLSSLLENAKQLQKNAEKEATTLGTTLKQPKTTFKEESKHLSNVLSKLEDELKKDPTNENLRFYATSILDGKDAELTSRIDQLKKNSTDDLTKSASVAALLRKTRAIRETLKNPVAEPETEIVFEKKKSTRLPQAPLAHDIEAEDFDNAVQQISDYIELLKTIAAQEKHRASFKVLVEPHGVVDTLINQTVSKSAGSTLNQEGRKRNERVVQLRDTLNAIHRICMEYKSHKEDVLSRTTRDVTGFDALFKLAMSFLADMQNLIKQEGATEEFTELLKPEGDIEKVFITKMSDEINSLDPNQKNEATANILKFKNKLRNITEAYEKIK